jgi:glutaredoxin-like protein NrdH
MNGSGDMVTPLITLYSLQTCGHCKELKQYLQACGLAFRTVYVDMLCGDERSDTLRHIRRINPAVSFPTLTVGDKTIVGFKPDEIAEALSL